MNGTGYPTHLLKWHRVPEALGYPVPLRSSMPIYVYETVLAGGKPGKKFEVMQKISDRPLKKHPKTGKPVRRVFGSPSLPKSRFEKAVKQTYGKDSFTTKRLLHK